MSGTEVTYTSTWQDVLTANRLRMRPAPRQRIWSAVLALLGLANVAIGVSELPDDGMLAIAVGLFVMLAYPAWRLFLWAWLPRLSRRYHQQAAVLHEPITVKWGPDGLSTRSPHITSAIPWGGYIGRCENADVMLFFQTDHMMQFVPKRVLDAEQVESLRAVSAEVPPWRARKRARKAG